MVGTGTGPVFGPFVLSLYLFLFWVKGGRGYDDGDIQPSPFPNFYSTLQLDLNT